MNRLIPYSEFGTPFHGLATNNLLPHPHGDKTIGNDAASPFVQSIGGCIPVRHPAAPGANRNVYQQTRDTVEQQEWRDYALICGYEKTIEGIPGTGLGNFQWLYCDANGGTWVVRLDYTKGTTDITFDVHLEEIFGRVGRTRSFSSSILDTFVWTPDIPSWYSGSYTLADVVSEVDLDWVNTLAFSPDGSECYVNIFCAGTTTAEDINLRVFVEATPQATIGGYGSNTSTALIGVLKIDLTGAGDLDNDGAGINCTITHDLTYENGIVHNRIDNVDTGGFSFNACDHVTLEYTNDVPTYTGDICPGYAFTGTFWTNGNPTNGSSGQYVVANFNFDVILYKTPDGTVLRHVEKSDIIDWELSISGTVVEQFPLWTCIGNPAYPSRLNGWYWDGTTAHSGSNVIATLEWIRTNTKLARVTFFGGTPVEDKVEEIEDGRNWRACATTPGDSNPPAPFTVTTDTGEINDVPSTPGTNLYFAHEVRQLAQNLHYLANYISQVNNEGVHDMKESAHVVNDQGTPSQLWSGSYTDSYRPAAAIYPDFPNDRELVWSYQPVTGASTHGQMTLFAAYNGDVWQYC